MKWVCGCKSLPCAIEIKLLRDLLLVILYPVAEFIACRDGIPVQQDAPVCRDSIFIPFKEAPANDLRGFLIRRHNHCLTHPVQQLFEPLVVRLVLGAHLQLRRRNRNRQHHVVAPARFLGQIV